MLYPQGMQPVAILVFITTILVPLAQLLGMLYVLLPLRNGRIPPKFAPVFRFMPSVQPWGMMEVFIVGIRQYRMSPMFPLVKTASLRPA